jgi:hypothetical protein
MASDGVTPAPTGIPRDSCPFCGERAGVTWWNCLPGRVTCRACGKTSRVSQGAGGVGIVAGMLAGGGFTIGLLQYLGPGVTIIGALVICLSVMSVVTRLLIRLDPLDYGDRGGPS